MREKIVKTGFTSHLTKFSNFSLEAELVSVLVELMGSWANYDNGGVTGGK